MASLPPLAQVAGPHIAAYESLFTQADTTGSGIIGALEAANFLKQSGLPAAALSQIWDLSDPAGKGSMDKQGFFVALKLIALAQNNKDPTMANITLLAPPPTMSTPGSPAIAGLGTSSESWAVPVLERNKYDHIFDGLQPVNGKLTGDKVKPVLMNSKLPVDVLGRVWDLSDVDQDGFLDRDEFYVAMHLVYRALEKEAVPMVLPHNLIPPSKRKKGSMVPGGVQVLPPVSPPLHLAGPESPALPVSLTVGAAPVPAVAPAVVWVVTPAEKAKSDDMFKKADTDMDGLVNGAQVKEFLMQSGLPQATLAHIWNLCDILGTGNLNGEQFALAAHLISLKLKGVEPPQLLTPEMIPPSMRSTGASLQDGLGPLADPGSMGSKELDMISKDIEDLKRQKMQLEQEKSQKSADIKVRNSEVQALQKELDSITMTLKQLETQRSEAQKRLDELDDRRTKLDASVKEIQEKCEQEEKQIEEMNSQISSSERGVQNQEEELKRLRDELGELRLEEQQLEGKVEAGRNQLDQLGKTLTETQAQITQTRTHIQKLQETQNSINQSISQYNALISGDPDAEEPTPLMPSLTNDFSTTTGGSAVSDGIKLSGKDDPFQKEDPFTASSNTAADPFKNTTTDDPFNGTDPFKAEGFGAASSLDPFGEDPFKDAFGGSSGAKQDSAWGSADAFGASDPFSNQTTAGPKDPFGDDPFGSTFAKAKPTTAKNDPFQPVGGGEGHLMSPVNTTDPFGTDPFAPKSGKSPRKGKSPAPPPPSLPPKQKKAPPRPPAPKSPNPQKMAGNPAPDPFGGQDPFGGGTAGDGAGGGSSNFADFSPSKFSSEADQLAWATRDSQKEWKRRQEMEKQEKADLELAIALSKADSSA